MRTVPGKGGAEGIGTAVSVGWGVKVGGMGSGVSVGGTDVEAGAQPLIKSINAASVRNTDRIDFSIVLSLLTGYLSCAQHSHGSTSVMY